MPEPGTVSFFQQVLPSINLLLKLERPFFSYFKDAAFSGQAKSPDEPFGAGSTDNGGNFADFSAFEV